MELIKISKSFTPRRTGVINVFGAWKLPLCRAYGVIAISMKLLSSINKNNNNKNIVEIT